MNTKNQDIPQLVIDQVTTARDETTWTQKDIETLKSASLLKVNHNYRSLNKKLKADKKAALEQLKLNFKPVDDLLKKIDQEKENIALEMMKGLSAVEAFKTCLDKDEFETWQSMMLENESVNSD